MLYDSPDSNHKIIALMKTKSCGKNLEFSQTPKNKIFLRKNKFKNTALLSLGDIVISGGTGPLHLTTAVESYAIGLYRTAPISRTGLYWKNCIPATEKNANT